MPATARALDARERNSLPASVFGVTHARGTASAML